MNRILILGCSATKVPGGTPATVDGGRSELQLPAWQRYDGPLWRTLRTRWRPPVVPYRFSTRPLHDGLEVYALSALYGLWPATRPLIDYDARLSDKCKEGFWRGTLGEYLIERSAHRLCWRDLLRRGVPVAVCAGIDYRAILAAWSFKMGIEDLSYAAIGGAGIGTMRHNLGLWLDGQGEMAA